MIAALAAGDLDDRAIDELVEDLGAVAGHRLVGDLIVADHRITDAAEVTRLVRIGWTADGCLAGAFGDGRFRGDAFASAPDLHHGRCSDERDSGSAGGNRPAASITGSRSGGGPAHSLRRLFHREVSTSCGSNVRAPFRSVGTPLRGRRKCRRPPVVSGF